ncbi:MAG: M28 family peptidase, partial [Promethearchaeota archaeon]
MNLKKIITEVNAEQLFQSILKIQGIKHPIVNPKQLNKTADYIKKELKKYGLKTGEQIFTVEGFDATFRNIEGIIGEDLEGPELLVTSHYDTVAVTPGANDNGTGIAGMLETARVLAKAKINQKVRFVSFTLEELNPARRKKMRDKEKELKLVNRNGYYKTW